MIPAGVIARHVAQADLADFAEISARRAGGGVDRYEARILRGLKDSAPAGLAICARSIEPSGDTAIHESVAVVAVQCDFRIVHPALFSGCWVERDYTIEGRGQIKSSVDKKRRGFKAASLAAALAIRNIAGVKRPGHFQA